MISRLRVTLFVTALVSLARPASAQWTRVSQIPAVTIFSVSVNGDTIAASADTVVFVSTNTGGTWKRSTKVTTDGLQVQRVKVRNGRIFAGTRRRGVFVSADLGVTWTDFNQGLVGGVDNSQLAIIDMLIQGDSIYVATEGAGAWVRNLKSGTWQKFGNVFEPAQAAGMTFITAGGSRLLAGGGFDATVFHRDPGQADWTASPLFSNAIGSGVEPVNAIWTGSRWVVGTIAGLFLSATGAAPWTPVDPGAGFPLFIIPFAMHGSDLWAEFGSSIAVSHDEGSSWELLESVPFSSFTLAVQGNTLYASRIDGLFQRSLGEVASVPKSDPHLTFAVVGAQPVRHDVRFRFDLPSPARAVIRVYDLAGRRVGAAVDGAYSAGTNEVAWDAQELPPGVYHAHLSVGSRTETVRLVRAR